MLDIVIYTTGYCPYCRRAKALFDHKKAPYREIDVTHNDALREEMVKKAGGRRTVPQIFIGPAHVGGCDDLYALDKEGKLDPLLKPAG